MSLHGYFSLARACGVTSKSAINWKPVTRVPSQHLLVEYGLLFANISALINTFVLAFVIGKAPLALESRSSQYYHEHCFQDDVTGQ